MLFLTFLMMNLPAQAFSSDSLTLPQNFKFCVSTAAHQIEGNNTQSDWWEWENKPGTIKNGDTSLVATDSWNHVDEDIQNMKFLGVDTYRFSIEWAKIEPKENEFNEHELNRYIELIEKLRANQIEPMVTLYHFTLPIWVSQKGGWEWEGIRGAFKRFTQYAVSRIGKRVTLWITLNEPMSIISAGYMSNVFPPAKNNINSIGLPMANMIRAHADSYLAIHEILDSEGFKPQVGIAHHLRVFDPARRFNPFDRFLSRKFDQVFNWSIPNALQTGRLWFQVPFLARANFFIPEAVDTQDFFGLNYYSRDRIAFKPFQSPPVARQVSLGSTVSDLDWEIYPEGMGRLIDGITDRYRGLKIWITENGIADREDKNRSSFIFDHLKVLSEKINEGASIEGYCHWTLNDNFEWAEGYSAKFGLFSLDPMSLKRKPRPSALEFKKLIQDAKN